MKKITVEVDWFSEHTIEVSDEAYDLIISEGSDFTGKHMLLVSVSVLNRFVDRCNGDLKVK